MVQSEVNGEGGRKMLVVNIGALMKKGKLVLSETFSFISTENLQRSNEREAKFFVFSR